MRTGQLLLATLTVISAAVTIFVAVRSWYPEASPDAKPAILFLFLISGGLIVALVTVNAVYARKARYGRAIPTLNQIHGDLIRLASKSQSGSGVPVSEIRATCQHTVDHLSDLFSSITGRRCGVCVKVVTAEEHESQFSVKNVLAVPQLSRPQRRSIHEKIDHWLAKNTDFEALFADQRRYFFSNWLPGFDGYKNSSFAAYREPPSRGKFPLLGTMSRHLKWTLPYRSTIVCAIRAKPVAPDDEDATQDLIGYLCVDSRRSRTFSEDDDVEVLQGIAGIALPHQFA